MTDVQKTELQEHLSAIDFPATKQDIIAQLREQDAPGEIILMLRSLPERRFNSPTEISQAVGAIG